MSMAKRTERVSAAALVAVAACLLLVGMVSGTVLRHVVQAAPALATAVFVTRRFDWSRWAALPVFAFWLFIMALIWLHVLGLAHVVTGRFTAPEIVLTVGIGIACIAGLAASLKSAGRLRWSLVLAVILLAAAVQVGALWLSLRPGLADR
jgi:hypothetical protein